MMAEEGNQPAIEVNNLTFSLLPGGSELLQRVSFVLPQACRCVVVGENGAGKSMLLELLAGMKMAPPGNIRVYGQDPFRGSSGKRVALVQGGWRGSGGDPCGERAGSMRVWELLGVKDPAVQNGKDEASGTVHEKGSDRFAQLQEALGLGKLLKRHAGSLSDGERRRVDLGRKLKETHEVVLLDEATMDLDVLARKELMNFLLEDGAAVLNVTHVFDGLQPWATHVLHLHAGQLVRCVDVSKSPFPKQPSGLFNLVAQWLNEAKNMVDSPQFSKPVSHDEITDLAVQIKSLKYAYSLWCPVAVSIPSLKLPRGCRCVLVGGNGAGKSTLISILAGRRLIQEGEVTVLGKRAFHDHAELDSLVSTLSSDWKRQVAELSGSKSMVFRDLANNSIQESVASGFDMSLLAQRMLQLIQMLGIDPLKPIGCLSDGMMRRVQIALKLLRPANLLLVDEVTADLDVLARQALLHFLREEAERGCAVLYCTHILDGLDGWATHILRMRPYDIGPEIFTLGELEACSRMNSTDGLFGAVVNMLSEDAKAEPPQVVTQDGSNSGQVELPFGWQKRGASHAGAYGNYAWNMDTGPEDNWAFGSVAPAPPSMPSTTPDVSSQHCGGMPQQLLGMNKTHSEFTAAGGTQVQGGAFGFGCRPPAPFPPTGPSLFVSGAPDQHAPFSQGSGSQPMPAPVRHRADDPCPPGFGSRGNALPPEELVARGIIMPERNQ